MTVQERIEVLIKLGERLLSNDEQLDLAIHQAYLNNKWFTKENSRKAIHSIAKQFLQKEVLTNWLKKYDLADTTPNPQKVGIIMAGNIPMVGFHDLLCVFITGHIAHIKLSDKDRFLIPYCIKTLIEIDARTQPYFKTIERLQNFDAVIATGSNNSARYFEAYFGKYPHIIRKNRNAVAVLNGTESTAELKALGNDIFAYFGLGCRNVSKLYLPKGYDFAALDEMFQFNHEICYHNKYKNNYDYNLTLLILNKIQHIQTSSVLLIESDSLTSRIAELYYEYYEDASDLNQKLTKKEGEIQCIVSKMELAYPNKFDLGQAQQPRLSDYADGVDTLAFLLEIS